MAKRMLNFGEGARDGSGRGDRPCFGDVPPSHGVPPVMGYLPAQQTGLGVCSMYKESQAGAVRLTVGERCFVRASS